ncbi:MAG: hypothetical protein JWM74_6027, partial [Myxococcaceae bacterium]|nr:hypothetical protein [Myxococcaceae bacterium]
MPLVGDAGAGANDASNASPYGYRGDAACYPQPSAVHAPPDGGVCDAQPNGPCSDHCLACGAVGANGPCLCTGTRWTCPNDIKCSNDAGVSAVD